MPIYEFDCEQCRQPFEELVLRASQVDQVRCPQCDSDQVRKKISLFSSQSGTSSSSSFSSQACTTST
ncbi:MAG: FmdB family zinc ribbon protein [Anaerolineales bacterium]